MQRDSLDTYDIMPENMINYLKYYGRHFNKKLCDFAISKMKSRGNLNKPQRLDPMTKQTLDSLLDKNGIKLENNELYDYVFVANMCKADFYGSSIIDDKHLGLYVKDVIDDVDAYDGIVFNRWYADTVRQGIPIEWGDMI